MVEAEFLVAESGVVDIESPWYVSFMERYTNTQLEGLKYSTIRGVHSWRSGESHTHSLYEYPHLAPRDTRRLRGAQTRQYG